MATLEIPAVVSIDRLVDAIEQLPPAELGDLVRRVIAIQTRRGVPLLAEDEEQALLITATQSLPSGSQSRLDNLRDKSREGILSPAEQAELLAFVQQVERQDLARAEALVRLAQKRQTTVSALLHDLGLEPRYA
jgi:hypothetical protein